MAVDYLTMNVQYNVKNGKFKINSDMKKKVQSSLLETFLRGQIGKGEDKSKAVEKDVYNITLKLYLENDRIEVTSDTGNEGLRDGVLLNVFQRL